LNIIRILLVDDHQVIRTGLRAYLETQEGFDVVAEADNGESAIQQALEHGPAVVVMDITMPQMDGMEATRRLKAECPECKVLALTVHEDKQYLFEMLAAGAAGYITKQAAAHELVSAIRAVADGHVYLQPALASWLLEDYRRLHNQEAERNSEDEQELARPRLEVLSDREIQVLERVAEGLTNIEIGQRLGISPKTVARHRERIMDKLDLHSSTQLVKFAIRSGVIEL
jgi:two-component system response regulator NreC